MPPSLRFMVQAFAFVLCLCSSSTEANPVAIDPASQPASMIAENVRVLVGAGESKVTGRYKFQLDAPSPLRNKVGWHVNIYVPVLVPYDAKMDDYRPILQLNGRKFTHVETNDLAYEDHPGRNRLSLKLPKRWGMRYSLFQIPERFVSKQFEITVEYVQPHFPGDVVGYVPIAPPNELANPRVEFAAQKDRVLKEATGLTFFTKAQASLGIVPEDRKLIRVRSLPHRETLADKR